MAVKTSEQRIKVRALGLSCLLLATLPTTAFAAQSAVCMRASLAHSTHSKDAAKLDLQCRLSSIKSGSGGAGAAEAQAQARKNHLEHARTIVLAKQPPAPQEQRAQSYQSHQSYSPQPSPAQPGLGNVMQRIQMERARRQFLLQQQQQQVPAQAPAPMPAYAAAPAPAPTAAQAEPEAPSPPDPLDAVLSPGPRDTSLSNDQTVAARAKTDLSVFGVALGDPLNRPRCVAGAPAAEPCIAERGFGALVASVFNGRIAKLSDFTNVPLHLPEAQCPDWLKAGSCDVVLAMSGGYVYAAFMAVGGEDTQAVIETQLTQKYGKKADKGPLSQCKKDGSAPHPSAPLRVWQMRGLRVEYDPDGTSCASAAWRRGSGQLVLETDTFRRMVSEASTKAEPKM